MRAVLALGLGLAATFALGVLLSPPSSGMTPAPSPTPPPTLTPPPSPTPSPTPAPPVARVTVTYSGLWSPNPCQPNESCCVPEASLVAPLSGTVYILRMGECISVPVANRMSMWSTCQLGRSVYARVYLRAAPLMTAAITSYLRVSAGHGPGLCWGTIPAASAGFNVRLSCWDQTFRVQLPNAGCGVGAFTSTFGTVRCLPDKIRDFTFDFDSDVQAGRYQHGSGAYITSTSGITLHVCAGPLVELTDCFCQGPGACFWDHLSRTYIVSGTFPDFVSVPLTVAAGVTTSFVVSSHGRVEVSFRNFVTPFLVSFGTGGSWYYSHTCLLPSQRISYFSPATPVSVEFSCPGGGRLFAAYGPSPTTRLVCPFVPGDYRVRGYPPYAIPYAPEVTDSVYVSGLSIISNSFAVAEVWSPPVPSLPAPGDWIIPSPIITQPVGTYCVVIPPPAVIDFARSIPGLGEWIDFDSITYFELCLRAVRFYYAGPLYERAVVLMNSLALLVIASLVFLIVRSLRS